MAQQRDKQALRWQFNLRSLMVTILLIAIPLALGQRHGPFAGVSVVAALLGIGIASMIEMHKGRSTKKWPVVVVVSAIAGLGFSPFQVAFEWSGAGHPPPQSDTLFVLFIFTRCTVFAGLTGFVTLRLFTWAK